MKETRKKAEPLLRGRKIAKSGLKKAKSEKTSAPRRYDPPFDVDVCDDGDIATPKRDLDEDAIKEGEDNDS